MKTRILAILTLLVVSASAYAAGPISFGFQATGANLNVDGPLKEVYGFGVGGGAHLDINLPVLLGIRVQGDFVTFSPDEAKYRTLVSGLVPGIIPQNLSIEGGRINILSVNANGKLSPLPLPIISPYLTAGGGIANMSVSETMVKYQGNTVPVGSVASETNASANLGVGVDLNLIAVTLFLEARYTWIFTSGATSTYVPISLGITF